MEMHLLKWLVRMIKEIDIMKIYMLIVLIYFCCCNYLQIEIQEDGLSLVLNIFDIGEMEIKYQCFGMDGFHTAMMMFQTRALIHLFFHFIKNLIKSIYQIQDINTCLPDIQW